MTATLSIVDNENETITATIGGSTSGTNTLYVARWRAGLIGVAWLSAGTRTGDGTIVASVAPGLYFVYVHNAAGSSRVVGIKATSGDAPLYQQILDAVADQIGTLSLAGLTSSEIFVRKLPWNRNSVEPGIHVTPTRETIERVVTSHDDFGYGVQVTIVQPGNQHLTRDLETELDWRRSLIQAFQPTQDQPPLAGVSEVYDVRIEPGPVIDPPSFLLQHDVQAVLLRFFTREIRGI